MKTGQKGIDLIKRWEALVLEAYLCPAGVWTIGWGSTKDVKQGMRITQKQAEERLTEDLKVAERAVKDTGVELSQNAFDALVSFVFNVGVRNFQKSTLRRRLLSHDGDLAAAEFDRWIYAKDPATGKMRPLPGLAKRRAAEKALFLEAP